METGDERIGGHRDAQGLFCCCTSTARFSQSSGDGCGTAEAAAAQQRWLCAEAPGSTLPLSLRHALHHALGARAAQGDGAFTWLVNNELTVHLPSNT